MLVRWHVKRWAKGLCCQRQGEGLLLVLVHERLRQINCQCCGFHATNFPPQNNRIQRSENPIMQKITKVYGECQASIMYGKPASWVALLLQTLCALTLNTRTRLHICIHEGASRLFQGRLCPRLLIGDTILLLFVVSCADQAFESQSKSLHQWKIA
jgi:hypothetical protein